MQRTFPFNYRPFGVNSKGKSRFFCASYTRGHQINNPAMNGGVVDLVRNLSQGPYPFYALKGGVWTFRRQSSPRLHLAFHDRRKIGLRAVGRENMKLIWQRHFCWRSPSKTKSKSLRQRGLQAAGSLIACMVRLA